MYYFLRKAAGSASAVSMYHATLSEETKSHIYHTFSAPDSPIRFLCATVAFGMVSVFLLVVNAVCLNSYSM